MSRVLAIIIIFTLLHCLFTKEACVLTSEETVGPYYVENMPFRQDVREDRQGIPLKLNITVVDTNSECKPLPGAVVEIWHCDSQGVYSHYQAQSLGTGSQTDDSTFLRGKTYSDSKGVASFITIYPGWYEGRTVHIHVRVHFGGLIVHTGQLYFNETITDWVSKISPYSSHSIDIVSHAEDGIFNIDGLATAYFLGDSVSDGFTATVTAVVNSTNVPAAAGFGPGMRGPGILMFLSRHWMAVLAVILSIFVTISIGAVFVVWYIKRRNKKNMDMEPVEEILSADSPSFPLRQEL
ncbi:catechol dioxygenase [Acrasis kona]|uniref:Catechol dioxygenase n=1 Tax=Acrasis kona TaxID=1008807 RepID=A0AAW2ZRZ4_9EUKA